MALSPLNEQANAVLIKKLTKIEDILDADVIAISSEIRFGLERVVRDAIEAFPKRRKRVAVIIHTIGGIVEVVERMVNSLRHNYSEVYFLVPDIAMSAGTVFVMSGDKIYMSYFSCLGPTDPQVEKEGKLIPALSYLNQFEELNSKGVGALTTAEYALLNKLDLGELDTFKQARLLSTNLLKNWLSTYKFKDWTTHSSTGKKVSQEERESRAEEIGDKLSDNAFWHSHSRGISREVLMKELNLQIEKMEDTESLNQAVEEYHALMQDFMKTINLASFIHTRCYI